MNIRQRLATLYRRLIELPPARSAWEAINRVQSTLDEVEDQLSGLPKRDPPPPPTEFDGRLYMPCSDYFQPLKKGWIRARTRNHFLYFGPDGTIYIQHRKSGKIEFEQAGGGST